jgi:gephyrin
MACLRLHTLSRLVSLSASEKDIYADLYTIVALMARPVAGLRKQTLILTLPGSPKGAKENLEAVLKLLPHACIQAAGAESRPLHVGGVKKLEKEAGVSSDGAAAAGMTGFEQTTWI